MGLESQFWVVDVEGNGGQPPEIVELAMVEVAGFRLTGRQRHWLVRPENPIQPSATRIHGLSDDDVADAPSIGDIADDILTWLNDVAVIGHNVRIELDIIARSVEGWSPRSAIDTLKLARTLRPGLQSYGLQNLGQALGLAEEAAKRSGRGHHSAIYDATLAALIFVNLMERVPVADRLSVLNDADLLNPRQPNLI